MNNFARRWTIPLAALVGASVGGRAHGQSLMEDQNPPVAPAGPAQGALPSTPSPSPANQQPALVAAPGPTSTAERLQSASLFAVVPPKPKTYQKHDQLEVIINESSVEKMHQKLDTKKNYDFSAELARFPSIEAFLSGTLQTNGSSDKAAAVGVKSDGKWKGEGTQERNDNLTARISAQVIDVKPNGMLVIEAKKSRQQDEELYVLVLSGVCRTEDITKNNTVQSGQLADLTIRIDHEGQVKKSAEKGLIPRFFDFLFNF